MKLLAIDTATEMCSVALLVDNQILSREAIAPRSHTELILPMVDAVLQQADCRLTSLDAIVFDRGPGAFTGLRIGTALAQGLALGADLPVIPVSSLATLAQGAFALNQATQVLACIDARKAEVYWACFRLVNNLMQAVSVECVGAAVTVHTSGEGLWYGIGSGFAAYPLELTQNSQVRLQDFAPQRYPLASDMLPFAVAAWQLNQTLVPEDATPVYIRNDVAVRPGPTPI
jgi:tRNA threonylcarbamoyladenosine biosynthesis protein TsaB